MRSKFQIEIFAESDSIYGIDRKRAVEQYLMLRKRRNAFALAINASRRKNGSMSEIGESLRNNLGSLRREVKGYGKGKTFYARLTRTIHGQMFERTYNLSNSDPEYIREMRKKALQEIIRDIKQYREDAKRIHDPIYSRVPGGMLREFQSKVLKLPKRPKDTAEYVGIEIECITPKNVDWTKLLPFSKYIEVGSDGSIDHRDNERGTEFRVCLKRSELREVLPPLMETIRSLGAYVNKSCGMHVHLDQREAKNPALTFQHLVRSLGLLYTVVPASRRRNTYCKRNRHADWDLGRRGDRYKAINASAFSRHGTIEVRLFGGTLEETKIINWIEVLYAIVEGETVMRCPKSFDTALKYWKLSDENLAWLKDRQSKYGSDSLTISEHETESNAAILDENDADPEDDTYCEHCDSSDHYREDCECDCSDCMAEAA